MIEDDNRVLNYRGLEHLVEKLKLFFIKRPITGTEGQYLRLTSTGAVEWASFPSIFTYMGSKSTVADVWAIKNAKQGDVWSVGNDEYFCKVATTTSDYGEQHWELIGLIITPYTLPVATSSTLGGIQLYTDTKLNQPPQTPSTTTDRTYAVLLNSSNQAVVNVPWSDSGNTTYTFAEGTTDGAFSVTPSGGSASSVSVHNVLKTTGGIMTGLVYYNESGTVTSTVTCERKYNWLEVTSPTTTLTITAPPSSLAGPCDVIYAVKNNNVSGGSNVTLNFPTSMTGGTVHNMIGEPSFTIAPLKIAELVFTFWSTTDVSFNGGVEE